MRPGLNPLTPPKDRDRMTDTHPGHIPATDLADLLNNEGHKRADFVRDLHRLVAKHAITTVKIATGATAHHPAHGHITIISAHPTTTGHVTIAAPHEARADGTELHTVYAHELTTDRPPTPKYFTTRQHYQQAPIGTRATVVAGDTTGITYTKKGPGYWSAGHMYEDLDDANMAELITRPAE